MSAQPAPHLRVVDEQGVARDLDAYVRELEDHISGLQRDIKAEHMRYENLKRDLAREAREHELFPLAQRCFCYWKRMCSHPRSAFTPERFWAVQPFLSDPEYGLEPVLRAIAGARHDPYETKRKNGSTKVHNGWGLIFRDADRFEEFRERAPSGWKLPEGVPDGPD